MDKKEDMHEQEDMDKQEDMDEGGDVDEHQFSGIETLLHDSIYETAHRLAILPSRLHMHEVQYMLTNKVNGGGFADIYEGTLNDGRVIAMKVPRCFDGDQIRKVHAVSLIRISRQCPFLHL